MSKSRVYRTAAVKVLTKIHASLATVADVNAATGLCPNFSILAIAGETLNLCQKRRYTVTAAKQTVQLHVSFSF